MTSPAATTRPPGLFADRPQPWFYDRIVEMLRVLHPTIARALIARFRLWTVDPRLFPGIRTLQELLGHSDVRTTMMYTHVLNCGGRSAVSPADSLAFSQHNAPHNILRGVQDKQ